jgi:hypothetical protein
MVPVDGKNDAQKAKPKPVTPITIPQLYATIMHTMGINSEKEIITPIGRPIRFADAGPVPSLLKESAARSIR